MDDKKDQHNIRMINIKNEIDKVLQLLTDAELNVGYDFIVRSHLNTARNHLNKNTKI